MQAINNNSYLTQGVQPNNSYNQAQIHMPKPPVAEQISQNQYQTSMAQVQPTGAQQAQIPQMAQTQSATSQAQTMPIYPQGVNIPAGGAVNINIFNPTTTNGAPIYPQNTYYTPTVSYPNYIPQNTVTVPKMPAPANAYSEGQNVQMPQPQQMQTPQAPQAQMPQVQQMQAQNPQDIAQAQVQNAQSPKEEGAKADPNAIPLTDAYIKNLEAYLSDGDPKVRLAGTTELLKRFKEDDTRKSDPALTALLNKSLKDPSASVRQMALTILNVGYAVGNEETIAILNNIKANKTDDMYAEDAVVAKEILLKLSGLQQNAPIKSAQV